MNLTLKIDESSSRLPTNSAPPRSASEVKNLLKRYNLRPSRGLGQNFLIDKKAVRKIIAAADLKPGDLVLEIGPGLGVLTQEMAKKVKPARNAFGIADAGGKVVAVEKDPKMVTVLEETLKDHKNVEIIQEDILKFQITNYKSQIGNYKIVASLPFYLTAPVIRKFLEAGSQPELMALIVQKEVAQRITARPPKMNLLAVSVQFYAEPKIVSYVSKKSFWPQPKVDSAIINLKAKSEKRKVDKDLFFKIAKAGFSQPRKMLINNLSKNLKADKIKTEGWLCKNNVQPTQRAETLSIKDWINLTESFRINQ